MPRLTPAASATSRTVSPAQPRLGKSSRPAASRARSRFRLGRGGMDVTIRMYNYVVKRLESGMPTSPEEAFAAACAEAAAGRPAAARDALLQLRSRLGHSTATLELQLGAACLQLGELEAAATALTAALAFDPSLYHAHALLSRARADLGDAAGAEASLREAERHAPDDAAAWRDMGQRHAEYWRWDDADRLLDRAAALAPRDTGTLRLAAIVKGERGDDDGARRVLEQAVASDGLDLEAALS